MLHLRQHIIRMRFRMKLAFLFRYLTSQSSWGKWVLARPPLSVQFSVKPQSQKDIYGANRAILHIVVKSHGYEMFLFAPISLAQDPSTEPATIRSSMLVASRVTSNSFLEVKGTKPLLELMELP